MSELNRALITGASGGIGYELAKIHAERGKDLVLVARSEDKLVELKQQLEASHNIHVDVLAVDLTDSNAPQQVFDYTQSKQFQIDILINNAGFGGHGKFHEQSLESQMAMMQLNMNALTSLSHLYLKPMVERKKGKILNVSSTASFMPGPLQAVYYATKAYVTSFSQALAEEVRQDGVSVTALCPGAVATGFVEAGNLDGVDIWKNAKSARSVAEVGYQGMMKNELVTFNEKPLQFLLNWVVPLLPRKTVLKLSRGTMEKAS